MLGEWRAVTTPIIWSLYAQMSGRGYKGLTSVKLDLMSHDSTIIKTHIRTLPPVWHPLRLRKPQPQSPPSTPNSNLIGASPTLQGASPPSNIQAACLPASDPNDLPFVLSLHPMRDQRRWPWGCLSPPCLLLTAQSLRADLQLSLCSHVQPPGTVFWLAPTAPP